MEGIAAIKTITPRILGLFPVLLAALPIPALADCHWNHNFTFFGCDTLGVSQSVGRTLPVAGDSIRFNPASLPTAPSPLGLETVLSNKSRGDSKLQSALVKGFHRFGLGAVNWTEDSFSTPNLQRYLNTVFASQYSAYQQNTQEGFRLGSALNVPLGKSLERKLRINIGVSYGQGRVAGSSSSGLGATLDAAWLSLGYSGSTENISPLLPPAKIRTLSFGIQQGGVYFGYTRMSFGLGAYSQPAIQLLSFRWASDRWAAYAALKKDVTLSGASQKTYNASLQYKTGQWLALGYMYGFYREAHSILAQIYL